MKIKLITKPPLPLKMLNTYWCILIMLLGANYSFGQVPSINYPSPQIYNTDVAITPLFPSNSGGPVTPTTIAVLANGFNGPNGTAVDAAGNVYVSDGSNNVVKKIPVGGGAPVTIGTGFNYPQGIAADSTGNVYVTDTYNNVIKEIPADGSAIVIVGPTFNNPNAIALDSSGNIYVCDVNGITEMQPGGGSRKSLLVVQPGSPILAIGVDHAGNVYYSYSPTNQLKEKLSVGGSTVVIAAEPMSNIISGIAIDAKGNVYYSDFKYNYITMVKAATGQKSDIGSGFASPFGISIDTAGRIYVSDIVTNRVSRISIGGYFISPALPQGLNLDTNTGVIGGTPSLASAAANYMVTAYNSSGSGSTTVNLTVKATAKPAISYSSPDVYHINKKIAARMPVNTGGAITAAKPVVISSGVNMPYGVVIDAQGNIYYLEGSQKDVRKIPAGGGSSVLVASGFTNPFCMAIDGSGNIFVGDNDGSQSIKKIPTGGGAVVTFAKSPVTYNVLAADSAGNIYIGGGGNIMKFAAAGGAPVTLALLNFFDANGITADHSGNVYVTDDTGGKIVKINTGTHAVTKLATAGTPLVAAAVDRSGNVYSVERDAHNLCMYVAATGNIITLANGGMGSVTAAALDANNNLYVTSFLSAQLIKITTSGYYIDSTLPAGLVLAKPTGLIHGTPTVSSPATTYNVTAINSGGTSSASFSLSVLANSALSNLVPSVSNLGPPFRPETLDYNMTVASSVSSIAFTPTVADSLATVTVNGVTVASGTASAAIPLTTGDNAVHVVVTATDGSTSTYSVLVTRLASPNNYLATLALSNGVLSPTFSHLTNGYTTQVGAYVASITVTPTTVDPTATIAVNGTAVTSGSASAGIPLTVGTNPINIAVTAQDGTVNTYLVTVTRISSDNAYLMGLKLNKGFDLPLFSHLIFNYATPVPNAVSSLTVTPTGSVSSSTITVNGVPVASGSTSADIPLAVGVNNIYTVVTAQDGITQNTYTITVTRAPVSLNTVYQPVGVATINGLNQVNGDGILVHNGLSPNGDGVNDFLLIDGIANYPENKLQIMTRNGQLVFEGKGYDNSNKVFDGHSNKTGKMQLPGTYFYSLDYVVKGEVKHQTGFVVLKY